MADTIFSSGNDQWVCPNDRQLALRAKLQTGWSVHTYQTEKQRRSQCLSPEELEVILQVIQRAERLDILEQQRIGRLVERLETMQRNVLGNGLSQCLLCGEVLGFLGSSSVFCKDCRKVSPALTCHAAPQHRSALPPVALHPSFQDSASACVSLRVS